jgi:TIR domain/NACHT domain
VAALSLLYCYASEDEALCDQLEKHLRQLQRQGLISTWHERKILPGGARAHEIDTHLETASIILLLVSPDFLSSDYCYDIQMQRTLERHKHGTAQVIPIILRPCDWQHSPLQDLQCLPRDGKPVTQWPDLDTVFHSVTQDLRRLVEQQQALTHPPVALSSLDRQNRIRMLKQVRATWIDGLLKQSLHQAARIELHLQDRPDVLANPWRLQVQELDQAPQMLPDGTSIVDVYDSAGGELLILGEPGAGKTTLLLELTRTLLEWAEQDERLRIPVVFHLSSWAEKRQPLGTWLVEELLTKYQVPRKIGQRWIDTDQVLPLLDGLDEMAEDARSACVRQINGYYQSRLAEQGDGPIVICCRDEEYEALPTRITLQHAVSILPLSDEQIDAYLEQAGEQVKALRQVLNEDTELRSLARQPLMLTIFTFAYQGAQASEVPIGVTSDEARRTIFARYVEHMLKRRGKLRLWEPVQVIDWLMLLAKQMQQSNYIVFTVADLQPTWLSKRSRLLYRLCVVLAIGLIGLVGGLFFGLVDGLVGNLLGHLVGNLILAKLVGSRLIIKVMIGSTVRPVDGLDIGLIFGPIFGLICGLRGGLKNRLDTIIKYIDVSDEELMNITLKQGIPEKRPSNLIRAYFWSWREDWSRLIVYLVGGLVCGLSIGLVGGPLLGTVGGMVIGLALVLLEGRRPEGSILTPNEIIWKSGKDGLRDALGMWLFSMPIMALLLGLVIWLGNRQGDGLFFGMLVGLFVGPFIGLGEGLSSGLEVLVKHFVLRFLLWLRGDLPWNLVPFLDEVAERLLLRKVGGSYIFVHRMLMDYFVDLEENVRD